MKTIKLPEDVVKKLEEVKTKEGYDSIEAIVFEALDVFVFFTKKEIRENLDLEYIG